MMGRDPAHAAALPTRREDCEHNLLPLGTEGQFDRRVAK